MITPLPSPGERRTQACDCGAFALQERLSEAELEALERHTLRRWVAKGEVLFRQGEPASVVVVHEGLIKLTRHDAGQQFTAELLFPGDVCNHFCAPVCSLPDLTATALTPARVALISMADYRAVVSERPEIREWSLSFCMGKVREQRERLMGLAFERTGARLARLLLMLSNRLGRLTAQGSLVPRLLDRNELAAFVGTSPETIVRLMTSMRKAGVVRENRREWLLVDPARLRAIATGAL